MIERLTPEQITVGDLVILLTIPEDLPASWNVTGEYAWKIWTSAATGLPEDAVIYRSDNGFEEVAEIGTSG